MCDRLQLSTNTDFGRFDVDGGRLYTPVSLTKSEKIMQVILSSKQIMDTYSGKLEDATGSRGKKRSKLQDTIVLALEGVAEPRDGTSESRPLADSDDVHFSQDIDDQSMHPPQRPIEQVMFKLPPCILMTVYKQPHSVLGSKKSTSITVLCGFLSLRILYTSEYDCY